jgi:hypothetical protein
MLVYYKSSLIVIPDSRDFFYTIVVQLTIDQSKLFTGEVGIDENYFGARRVSGIHGRGADEKIQVVGLLKRRGCVYVKIVEDCYRN